DYLWQENRADHAACNRADPDRRAVRLFNRRRNFARYRSSTHRRISAARNVTHHVSRYNLCSMPDKLDIIAKDLERLRASWPTPSIFGEQVHRYRLNRPLSEEQ